MLNINKQQPSFRISYWHCLPWMSIIFDALSTFTYNQWPRLWSKFVFSKITWWDMQKEGGQKSIIIRWRISSESKSFCWKKLKEKCNLCLFVIRNEVSETGMLKLIIIQQRILQWPPVNVITLRQRDHNNRMITKANLLLK